MLPKFIAGVAVLAGGTTYIILIYALQE